MATPLKIFSGRTSRDISHKIAKILGVKLGNESVVEFTDGEIEPSFDETVRGANVFLF
jgi:ribose-phosphate pyrophosphokinase